MIYLSDDYKKDVAEFISNISYAPLVSIPVFLLLIF